MSYEGGGSDPVQIMRAMSDVEDSLNELLATWPDAEANFKNAAAVIKRVESVRRVQMHGTSGTIPEKAAFIEGWLWEHHSEEMAALLLAEATIEACKAKYKLLDRLLSSLQSRLAAERDLGRVPPNMGRSYA